MSNVFQIMYHSHFNFHYPGFLPLSPPFLICSANPDQDYNTLLAILTFSSTVSSQSVDVTINDDTIDENDELFIGNLLSATNPRVQLNPTAADILIMDNDSK